jgi:hypothetical protein
MIRRSESAILSGLRYREAGTVCAFLAARDALTRAVGSGTRTHKKTRPTFLFQGCGNVIEHFASISVCEWKDLAAPNRFLSEQR